MRMTVVAEPDNRRDKGVRDSNFCKGSHDASVSLRRQVYCAGGCAGLGETWTGFGAGGGDGGADIF
jgi:hypothetical protein